MSYLQRKDGSWTAFGDATWNEGDHPRVPEGQAGAGQFTGGAGGGGPTKEPPPAAPSTNAGKKIAAILNSSLSIAAKLAAIKGGNFPINKPESKAYKAAAIKWLQEAQQEPVAPQPETKEPPKPPPAPPDPNAVRAKEHLASYQKGMALFAAAKAFDNAYGAEQRKAAPSLRGSWWRDKQAGKEAALAYKGGSGAINGLLRKGPKAAASEATKKHLAQLDSLFYEEGAALKDDVILRRGEGVPQEQIDQMKEELKAGLPCRYQKTGFISTSMAGYSAFAGHSTQFEIVARKGTRVLGLAALPGFKNENEVLMQHGTAFEVLEITKVGHQNVIKMVVL